MKGLTPRQLEVLQFIQQFVEQHHYSPSYREMMDHFDFTSPGTVYKLVRTLERKGALSKEKHAHRSIFPAQIPNPLPKQGEIQIPLIGNLSAGYPLELYVQPQLVAVPASLIHQPEHTYLLQAQGDALHDEWILDGDLLIIEARQLVEPGEVILGLINQNDTILKKYFPEGQHVRLESQNPTIAPLTIHTDHMAIQGVMNGLLRFY